MHACTCTALHYTGTRASFGARAAALDPAPASLFPTVAHQVHQDLHTCDDALATADKMNLVERGHRGARRQAFQSASPQPCSSHAERLSHVIGASQQGRSQGSGGLRVPLGDACLGFWLGQLRPPTTLPASRDLRYLATSCSRCTCDLFDTLRRGVGDHAQENPRKNCLASDA